MSFSITVRTKGGSGDDSIESGGDDVTIVSGAGHDTINITGGSAWIKDYSARKDQLIIGDGGSTVKSHGGILVTFEATDPTEENDQLAALIDVDAQNDELSSIIEPTAIEIGADNYSFDAQIFNGETLLQSTLNQRKRRGIKD